MSKKVLESTGICLSFSEGDWFSFIGAWIFYIQMLNKRKLQNGEEKKFQPINSYFHEIDLRLNAVNLWFAEFLPYNLAS